MLRQINRLLAELQSAARMAAGIGCATDFFLHLAIFNHALQYAGSDHQNVILLFLGSLECGGNFFFGALKVSTIEVDVRGI